MAVDSPWSITETLTRPTSARPAVGSGSAEDIPVSLHEPAARSNPGLRAAEPQARRGILSGCGPP